jgi:hypothetical protein
VTRPKLPVAHAVAFVLAGAAEFVTVLMYLAQYHKVAQGFPEVLASAGSSYRSARLQLRAEAAMT